MKRRYFIKGAAASVALIATAGPVFSAVQGDRVTSPNSGADIVPARPWFYPLTPRQAQVSELVAAGFSSAEIGASLGITEHMSKHHVSRTMRQLKLQWRSEIRDWVIKQQQER